MAVDPGQFSSPKAKNKARNNTTQNFRIADVLFADDTTLCGNRNEIPSGRDAVVETLACFEETCHPDKEEEMWIGSEEAGKIRILGSYAGRKFDTEQRRNKMNRAAFIIRKTLTRKTIN